LRIGSRASSSRRRSSLWTNCRVIRWARCRRTFCATPTATSIRHKHSEHDMSGDPTLLSAAELSRAIHQRRLTCTAVMEAYLGRIEALNPQINAIVSLRPRSELMEEAHAADHELEDCRSRGWLHGLPTAIKDLAEAKGLPCTW